MCDGFLGEVCGEMVDEVVVDGGVRRVCWYVRGLVLLIESKY